MPASSITSYLQDARNNFDAVRPAPICPDVNQTMGSYQNVHVSTSCYYGYQDVKNTGNSRENHVDTDCEMVELKATAIADRCAKSTSKKRSAEEDDYPRNKRLREAADKVQREKTIEPETNETMTLETDSEDLLECLFWNIHGGNMYHMIQCL